MIRIRNGQKGFTLIEALMLLFIFAIVVLSFFQSWSSGIRYILESKNRLAATALANQKMEILRNLSYDALGTVHGIPQGSLPEDVDVTSSGSPYHVHTFIQYVDDPFDGTISSSPPDTIPTDYKRIRISVSWGDAENQQLAVYTDISPQGMETLSGAGVLVVTALDAGGNPVSDATVHIVNAASSIDLTAQTNAFGILALPGAPAGNQNYAITVSKDGYYGGATLPPFPTSAFYPTDTHQSVVLGQLTSKAMIIDKTSDVTLQSRDTFDRVVPNASYGLSGGRQIGSTGAPVQPVYDFSVSDTTDAQGNHSYTDRSFGTYFFAANTPSAGANYLYWKTEYANNTLNKADQFNLSPGINVPVTLRFVDKRVNGIFAMAEKSSDHSPIIGATVTVTSVLVGSTPMVFTTDAFGYVYAPAALPELLSGDYTVQVSASGYQSQTATVTLSGGLQQKIFDMIAN